MQRDQETLEEARRILRSARRIAVVGLSHRPSRPSHGVASYLRSAGYEVLPVNPHVPEALGLRTYPDLRSVPGPVDLVLVFRRPEAVPAVVEEALAVGAPAVWLQPGARHDGAARRAREAGLRVVVDACAAVVHQMLRASGSL